MPEEFKFYKNENDEWYLDLPTWKGDPEDLQMIQGADEWLDLLSSDTRNVALIMKQETFLGADFMNLMRIGEDNLGGGGNYFLESFLGQKVNLKIWLCEVTKFIFGKYPQRIYFQVS